MQFELPVHSALARVSLGLSLLVGFTLLTQRAENAYFADRLSKIPLFGTELAIERQPRDAQYEYQLGNYWMIAAQQPGTGLPHFSRATQLSPHNGRYWGQLALAYQQSGDSNGANESLQRALAADPNTPSLLWEAANVYSYLGENEKALNAIHRFVLASPDQTPIAAQLAWRATTDSTLVLDRVLPRDANSELSLLIALVRTQDPEASTRIRFLDTDPNNIFVHNLVELAAPLPNDASEQSGTAVDLTAQRDAARAEMLKLIAVKTGRDWTKTESEIEAEEMARADEAYRLKQAEKSEKFVNAKHIFDAAAITWRRLMSQSGRFDIRFSLPYIQMLVDADQTDKARNAWASLVAREPRLRNWSGSDNLINNASFEYEMLNGGFDWQYNPSDATDLAVDHRTSRDGGSSLLMRFKDKPVADAGIVQYVPVRPGAQYEFTGFLKSESVEGATGIRFQVQDVDAVEPYFESEDVKGTTGWIKLTGRFTTRPSSHFVTVKIVRDPGNTLINGKAWADAVSLAEVGAK